MRKEFLFIVGFALLALLPFISGVCNDEQINVNFATLEELDQLSGIGPVKAQAIIDARPFGTIDDLINVKGIGNATLQDIKEQGLACVAEEDEVFSPQENDESLVEEEDTLEVIEEEDSSDEKKSIEQISTSEHEESVLEEREEETRERAPIVLGAQSPKDINTNENASSSVSLAPVFGLFAFALVIGGLLWLRERRYNHNEFTS